MDFNQEITYEDVRAQGVDTSMIKVCKKIRNLAKLDRLTLDKSEHRSGLNKHLFSYIEYCGLDMLQFIKEYLSNLQPYMLSRRKDQEPNSEFICVLDELYRISIYIKIKTIQFEEVVVSFHENNINGIAKNNIMKRDDRQYVPVFADSIGAKVENENKYVIKVFIQRGLKVLPLEIPAIKCKGVFIVEPQYIRTAFVTYCNGYIQDLYTSELDIDFSSVSIFSMLQQIPFTSYGRDTFSSISLLIDSLSIQSDFNSKATADFALVTFISNLKLTKEQCDELEELLEQKYAVSDIRGIKVILQRVEDLLSNEVEIL